MARYDQKSGIADGGCGLPNVRRHGDKTRHCLRDLYRGAVPRKPRLGTLGGCKWIFRYLKGTRNVSLVYGGKQEDLQGWTDADGASLTRPHTVHTDTR